MDVAITGLSALIQHVNNYQHNIRQRVEKRYIIIYIMLKVFFSDFNLAFYICSGRLSLVFPFNFIYTTCG